MSRRGRRSSASVRLSLQAPLKAIQERQAPRLAPRPGLTPPDLCLGCGEPFTPRTLTHCVCSPGCWPLAVTKFFPERRATGIDGAPTARAVMPLCDAAVDLDRAAADQA